MTISDDFKKLMRKEQIDKQLLVPLLIWTSGSEKNIEISQTINFLFKEVDKHILANTLTLNSKITHFFRYPKIGKDDERLGFFYNDICKYYGWTRRELRKNVEMLDMNTLKEEIATKFGYDNTERKIIGIKKITF